MSKSLDDILNGSVEDLIDMKEFLPVPVGSYKGTFDWEKSETPAGVRFVLKIAETLELANPDEASKIEPDTKLTQLFMFYDKDGNDFSMGQGQLKIYVNEVLKPVFGGDTLMETMDNAKGAEVEFSVKQRKDKNDPDKIYSQIGKVFKLAD